MASRLCFSAVTVVALFAATDAQARWFRGRGDACCGEDRCSACVSSCAPACQPQLTERTIQVPQWVTENRTITVTRCRPETRERTFTVTRCIPETQDREEQYTVMVPETRTRSIEFTVMRPTFRNVEQQYTVMVPHTERRQATRTVCRMVAEQQTRTICQNSGHWEQREVHTTAYAGTSVGNCSGGSCGDACQPCPTQCKQSVWVPETIQRQVQVTVMRPVFEQQPYEYNVAVCKPETRTRTFQVCEYRPEKQTREEQFTVCVPQQRTRTFQVTSFRNVSEDRKEQYTVMVPHREQQQIQVQVCRMVEQKIQVPASLCCAGI